MGFKHAAVLAPVSFFLGVLFICFNVDRRLLWSNDPNAAFDDALQFYTIFYKSPPAIKALIHGMVGLGMLGIATKLHKWDDSAMFFDGSSLGTYVFGVTIYLTVIIPALRTVINPPDSIPNPFYEGGDASVPITISYTHDKRLEDIRVLSAANVMVAGCLGLILFLQAGQEYARRQDVKARAQLAVKKST